LFSGDRVGVRRRKDEEVSGRSKEKGDKEVEALGERREEKREKAGGERRTSWRGGEREPPARKERRKEERRRTGRMREEWSEEGEGPKEGGIRGERAEGGERVLKCKGPAKGPGRVERGRLRNVKGSGTLLLKAPCKTLGYIQ